MKLVGICCILFWWNFLMKVHAFWPLWAARWCCLCKLGGLSAGMNLSWVLVDASAMRWEPLEYKCTSRPAGRSSKICIDFTNKKHDGSCLIRVSSMHYIKSIRMFEDGVTSPECFCDSRRFTRGLGWWSDVCNLKNVWHLRDVTVFWLGFFRLFVLRVNCECNRPSFLATVFEAASAFNGDLNQWDVATVTTMHGSKPIRLVENDLTWRELVLLWLEGSVGGLGWWWWCAVRGVLKNAENRV